MDRVLSWMVPKKKCTANTQWSEFSLSSSLGSHDFVQCLYVCICRSVDICNLIIENQFFVFSCNCKLNDEQKCTKSFNVNRSNINSSNCYSHFTISLSLSFSLYLLHSQFIYLYFFVCACRFSISLLYASKCKRRMKNWIGQQSMR